MVGGAGEDAEGKVVQLAITIMEVYCNFFSGEHMDGLHLGDTRLFIDLFLVAAQDIIRSLV